MTEVEDKKEDELTPKVEATNEPPPQVVAAAKTSNRGRPKGSVTKKEAGTDGEKKERKRKPKSDKNDSSPVAEPLSTSDIPIFSTEFIEHSKSREHESRQLRKELSEYEQQNSVLEKHIEGLKKSANQIQSESEFYSKQDDQMRRFMELIKRAVLDGLRDTSIPSSCQLEEDNFDEFVKKLIGVIGSEEKEIDAVDKKSTEINEFISRVRDIVSKIQFDSEIILNDV